MVLWSFVDGMIAKGKLLKDCNYITYYKKDDSVVVGMRYFISDNKSKTAFSYSIWKIS